MPFDVSILAAFITGVITAFLPCTFPVLFGYIGYMISRSKDNGISQRLILLFLFFIGFSFVYTFLGATVGFFGYSATAIFINTDLQYIFIKVGGLLLIVFGLLTLGAIPLPDKLKVIKSIKIPKFAKKDSALTPILFGGIFAAGWSPCIGPVLGGILVLASTTQTVFQGAVLLFVFSLGISVPLLFFSIFYGAIQRKIEKMNTVTRITKIVGGVILISIGILFLTGYHQLFYYLTQPFIHLLPDYSHLT